MHTKHLIEGAEEVKACSHANNSIPRRELANAIRALTVDAVQKANSGHPGMPMGMADIAEVLWRDFLMHNPANPNWINRDRFILSNGHGAMLHYALLHLSGYDLTLEDLQQFRQLHSRTPGHPEYGVTPGVETTTGPLGQGLANAVGMALAEKKLAMEFNREGFPIINHYTYVFLGDGCLMEGISHEVCSLAGVHGLGKLIAFYDDNHISIDGEIKNWFQDDTVARFRAYNWHVIAKVNGHDAEAIKQAIAEAQAVVDKPSFICCQTIIGYGSPRLAGTSHIHGSPLGEDEVTAVRESLGWSYFPFEIPSYLYEAWSAKEKGFNQEQTWHELFLAYQEAHPELAAEFWRRCQGKLPVNWSIETMALIKQIATNPQELATRKASKLCLDQLGSLLPELVGGSADLTESNQTWWQGSKAISQETPNGNYLYYGVREFGMFGIMNGLFLHGGLIPYGGTFLTFADYGKNAIRLSALMKTHVIYIFTHDSVGLGEDGPTHQPIEHIAMLRLIPNLHVWRPADALETAIAWKQAIEYKGPSCLLLSRQSIKPSATQDHIELIARGGYTLIDSVEASPDIILIATGSELPLAAQAEQLLCQQGIRARVVSMPCLEVFEAQPKDYQEQILPSAIQKRIIIEAGSTAIWYKYVSKGKIIGIDRFGESAPYQEVMKELGLTVANIVATAKSLMN
jgi:transketolase